MKTIAEIFLAPTDLIMSFYICKDGNQKKIVEDRFDDYDLAAAVFMEEKGEDAAEECFDLTNNPGRQDYREQVYGRRRSVSVGDVIKVDGVAYLCASTGWECLGVLA
jgi:hypothetical protein